MVPEIYDSFEEWLANPTDDNAAIEFNPEFEQPKTSNEAFERFGITGKSFYNAMKEAEYNPKNKNGEVELSYNPAFKSIDTNKAWQLWANNGAPFVKEKGTSHLITENESTSVGVSPLQLNKINKVLKSTGASILQSQGNPLLATLEEFPIEEVDDRTQGEKDLDLFESATEMAYESISSAFDILSNDN